MFRYALIALATALTGCGILILLTVSLFRHNPTATTVQQEGYSQPTIATSTRTVRIGSVTIRAEVAETEATRVRGLSGRTSLADGDGLLFVFPEQGEHGIWMRDMLFSIDVVWLDDAFQVVHLISSLTPATYPKVFTPPMATRYVLELPAGTCSRYGITIGSQAEIMVGEK